MRKGLVLGLMLVAGLMLSACAMRPGPAPAPVPPAAAPLPVPDEAGTQARARVAQATLLAQQTRALVPEWDGAMLRLEQARAALLVQAWPLAVTHADEATAQAEEILSDFYTRRANEALRGVQARTGLDETQLAELAAAEEVLSTGNSRLAYGRLRQLGTQLETRLKTHAVGPGETLWRLAGKPELYDNPWLWPLIWQANRAALPNPDRLRAGQVLRVRPHPTVDEVVDALVYARRRAAGEADLEYGVTPEIGEIRELSP